MPGVITRTATRSGPVNPTVPESGRYFVAGITERGPVNTSVRVRSLAEYVVTFGGRIPEGAVYDDLRMFFEEGGTEAYVVRVAGAAATVGTVTLDTAADSPALKVDAIGPGAWSANYQVMMVDAGTIAVLDTVADAIVETFGPAATAADLAALVNRSSRIIRATDLGAGLPGAGAEGSLSAGDAKHAAVNGAVVVEGLVRHPAALGAGAIAAPGYAATVVGADLIQIAKDTRRIALLAPARTDGAAAVIALADLIGVSGEYAGMFFPWVTIPTAGGATKDVSPEGYVAAMRARAHREVGPWRAPAGAIAVARFVTGPTIDVDRATGDLLDEAGVSAIRTISGTTRLYGWRSLSNDRDNYALLTGRDVLNTVAVEAEKRLEQFVFETIDGNGRLLSAVATELVGLLAPMRKAGGLYPRTVDGEELDPGYSVDVGETVNTIAVLNANKVAAVIALRVSPVGSLIDVTIVKAGLSAVV